ncbi:DNA polymerase Y family protein [Ethanoligenens sp.]|uniref:DNA polymerase Y family protein n=1 Tax=Ethanoligenens sp. TaxID=2099655 RepID=UPI0039EB4D06
MATWQGVGCLAYLDLTGTEDLFGDGKHVADELRRLIRKELGITASVGVSWNKVFAKLGSDYKKPDATTVFARQNFKEKVWPLPASDLLYVGPATTKKLHGYGINTIGDLATAPLSLLKRRFGKWGGYLYAFANGLDTTPVALYDRRNIIKSIGNSMTTHRDIETPDEIRQVFLNLSESVARRLRENGFRSKTVQISIRDDLLNWCEYQMHLIQPACTVMPLVDAATMLFQTKYKFTRPLRALGVRACDLISMESGLQINFFADAKKQEQWEKIESCVDRLRERFGCDAVKRASILRADITGESDPLTHDVHPVGYFGR